MFSDQRGKWPRSSKRLTVSECLPLDVYYCQRNGILEPGLASIVRWTANGREVAAINVACRESDACSDEDHIIALDVSFRFNKKENVTTEIRLQRTEQFFGGWRWWFTCPACNRRCQKVYLLGPVIGCRICHDLTYTSCQTSHAEYRLMKRVFRWQANQLFLRR